MSDALALTNDLAQWLSAWHQACEQVKHWQATADTAKDHITAALDQAGATIGLLDGKPACRWTTVESKRVDAARLRADHPQLAERYTVAVTSQRFTIPRTSRHQP